MKQFKTKYVSSAAVILFILIDLVALQTVPMVTTKTNPSTQWDIDNFLSLPRDESQKLLCTHQELRDFADDNNKLMAIQWDAVKAYQSDLRMCILSRILIIKGFTDNEKIKNMIKPSITAEKERISEWDTIMGRHWAHKRTKAEAQKYKRLMNKEDERRKKEDERRKKEAESLKACSTQKLWEMTIDTFLSLSCEEGQEQLRIHLGHHDKSTADGALLKLKWKDVKDLSTDLRQCILARILLIKGCVQKDRIKSMVSRSLTTEEARLMEWNRLMGGKCNHWANELSPKTKMRIYNNERKKKFDHEKKKRKQQQLHLKNSVELRSRLDTEVGGGARRVSNDSTEIIGGARNKSNVSNEEDLFSIRRVSTGSSPHGGGIWSSMVEDTRRRTECSEGGCACNSSSKRTIVSEDYCTIISNNRGSTLCGKQIDVSAVVDGEDSPVFLSPMSAGERSRYSLTPSSLSSLPSSPSNTTHEEEDTRSCTFSSSPMSVQHEFDHDHIEDDGDDSDLGSTRISWSSTSTNASTKKESFVDKLPWLPKDKEASTTVSKLTLQRNAQSIIKDSLLHISQHSRDRALETALEVVRMLETSGHNQIVLVPKEEHAINSSMRDSIGKFLNHDSFAAGTQGRRSDIKQHAQNAVLCSFVSPPTAENHIPAKKLAKHLDFKNNRAINRGIDIRKQMDTMGTMSDPFARLYNQKQRKDNIEIYIANAVDSFCHDPHYTKLDSWSNRKYRVDGAPKDAEKHRQLNWANRGNTYDQYCDHFLTSEYFSRMKKEVTLLDPEYFTDPKHEPYVSFRKFKKYLCKCIKPSTRASCVDIIEDRAMSDISALEEFVYWNHQRPQVKKETAQFPIAPSCAFHEMKLTMDDIIPLPPGDRGDNPRSFKVVSVLKKKGDEVTVGVPLLKVEHQGRQYDILSTFAGVFVELLIPEIDYYVHEGDAILVVVPMASDHIEVLAKYCKEYAYKLPTKLSNHFAHCSCASCQNPPHKNWLQIMKRTRELSGKNFIQQCLCEKVTRDDMKLEGAEFAPKFYKWECSNHECQDCGVDRSLPWECPVFKNLEVETDIWIWEKNETNGQQQVMKQKMPVKDIMVQFKKHLTEYISHANHLSWLNYQMKIDSRTSSPNTLLIFTDFASQMNLEPSKKINSHVNTHATLQIFFVMVNRRAVNLSTGRTVNYVDTDTWFAFGSCEGLGKRNDWVFHNAMLKKIVKHYKAKHENITSVRVWSDNCPTQYKCRQNFFQMAKVPTEIEGIECIEHCFARVHGFKGPWDACGKVIKDLIRRFEADNQTFAGTGFECYVIVRDHFTKCLPNNIDWEKRVADGHESLEKKSVWQATKRIAAFVTDDMEEYERLIESHGATGKDNFIYSRRNELKDVEDTDAIPGTSVSYYFKSVLPPTNDTEEEIPIQHHAASGGYSCIHCKEMLGEQSEDAISRHELLCGKNPLNTEFTIEYSKNPCFCPAYCLQGRSEECKSKHICGATQVRRMILLDQKRLIQQVLNKEKEELNSQKNHTELKDYFLSFEPLFPARLPTAEYMAEMVNDSQHPAKLRVKELKMFEKLLKLNVKKSAGARHGSKMSKKTNDYILAFETVGGFQALLDFVKQFYNID